MADDGLNIDARLADSAARPGDGPSGDVVLDRYVAALSRRLLWRPDRDDLVAEAADHLWLATEQLVARGMDRDRAQREVVERFGEPGLVARALATSRTGGVATPTRMTRAAGAAGVGGAIGLVVYGVALGVAGVLQFVDLVRYGSLATTVVNDAFTVLCFVVLPVTAVAVAGLLRRSRASGFDPLLGATVAFGAVTPAIGVLFHEGVGGPWLAMGLGVLLVSMLVAAMGVARLHRVGVGRLRTDWLLVGALPLGLAVGAVVTPFGPIMADSVPAGFLVGAAIWPMLFAVALLRRGQWLASEPAPLDALPTLAPLDLRWATTGTIAMVVGVASAAATAGYVGAKVLGFSRFLWVDLPGPAVTSGLIAIVLVPLGVAATRRAAHEHPEMGGNNLAA